MQSAHTPTPEAKAVQAPKSGLFIFGFDVAITSQSTNNILLQATMEAAIAFIKQHNPIFEFHDLSNLYEMSHDDYFEEVDRLIIEAARLKLLRDNPEVDFKAMNPNEKIAAWSLDEEKKWQIVSQIEPRGGAAKWKALFEKIWADGHQIGIATNSKEITVIKRYLREIVGLSVKQLDKIHITIDAFGHDVGLNRHIDETLEHFNKKENDTNVVLVTFDEEQIRLACRHKKLHPYGGILAPTKDTDEDLSKSTPVAKCYVTDRYIEGIATISEQVKNEIAMAQSAGKADEADVASTTKAQFYASGFTLYSPAVPVSAEQAGNSGSTPAPSIIFERSV